MTRDPNQVEALRKESTDRDMCGAENINDFIALLRQLRAVMVRVIQGQHRPCRKGGARTGARGHRLGAS